MSREGVHRGARVDPELVGQGRAQPPEHLERVRLAVLADQCHGPQAPQLLAQGVLGHQLLEPGRDPAAAAEGEVDDDVGGPGVDAQGVEAAAFGRRDREVPEVGVRLATPQRVGHGHVLLERLGPGGIVRRSGPEGVRQGPEEVLDPAPPRPRTDPRRPARAGRRGGSRRARAPGPTPGHGLAVRLQSPSEVRHVAGEGAGRTREGSAAPHDVRDALGRHGLTAPQHQDAQQGAQPLRARSDDAAADTHDARPQHPQVELSHRDEPPASPCYPNRSGDGNSRWRRGAGMLRVAGACGAGAGLVGHGPDGPAISAPPAPRR